MPDPEPPASTQKEEDPQGTPLKKDRSELIRTGCTVGPYILGHTIGRGSFGKVKYAMDQRNGNIVAVKIVQKSLTDDVAKTKLERELQILKMMEHPYVVKLHAILESVDFVFIVMENITGGELFDYIVAHSRVKEPEARRFFSQIALGIEYCHSKGVVHRDLKPENLLLDSKKNIKVIDFGLSNLFQGADQFLKSRCGSPHYSAPEVVSQEGYTQMADIFSLGIILFSLLTGALPFDGVNHAAIVRRMRAEAYRIPKHVSELACDLIKKMLKPNPNDRIHIHDVIEHPWLKVDNQKLEKGAVEQLKRIRDSRRKLPDLTIEPPTPKASDRRQSVPSAHEAFSRREGPDRSNSLPPGIADAPQKKGRFQRLFRRLSISSPNESQQRSESPVISGMRDAVENVTKGAFGLEFADVRSGTDNTGKWHLLPSSDVTTSTSTTTVSTTGSESPETETLKKAWAISSKSPKKVENTGKLKVEELTKKSRRLSVPNAALKGRPKTRASVEQRSDEDENGKKPITRPHSTDIASEKLDSRAATPPKTSKSPSFLKSIKDSIKQHKRGQSVDDSDRKSPKRPGSGQSGQGPSAYPGYGAFSQSATSTLSPKQITTNVKQVLEELKIAFRPKGTFQFHCKAQVKVYPSAVEGGEPSKAEEVHSRIERIKFTVEVFRLPRLNVHVVLYMRKQGEGDVWAHRAMCHKILSLLKI